MPAYRLTSSCIWNSFQNSNKKHIIITGDRGSGKSTLLNRLFPNPLPGITTWAVLKSAVYLKDNSTDNITQVGVYDNALAGLENKMKLCGDGFVNLGIDALNNALLSNSEWISIDEIGYLESQCTDYLNKIMDIMDKKHLLTVVRKQNLPHLKKLCEREDVFLIDLDAPFGNMGCVIMASGLGKRFGQNKLMAEFHGKPLISYVLDATSDIFQKRIVVTRHETIANLCKERNIDFILHTMPHRNDTIRLGLERLLDTKHCMFCTSDQPLLKQETIAALALSAVNASSKIIRPICEDILGSPVIFPKIIYDELLHLPDGKGGGYVIKQHPDYVQYLPIRNSNELEDIDTPEDLLRLS
ncbi:MAG: NTP transferase domain-containing protein [Lachnospiraceae bacterium]|nr:NTP transferase domain-containing protein [Lachnospiraceae bacterium]